MIKGVMFDLDDTLLWDEKSVDEAFKKTCHIASDKHGIDPDILEQHVRKHAESLYATYDTYPFVKNIGIGTFEAMWGEFQDEGDSFRQLREIIPEYRNEAWTKGLEDVGVYDEDLGQQLAEIFPEERRKNIFVYEDTFHVLNELKGKYPMLLLTNGSPDLQWTKLKLTPELSPYFDHIVISGDFGSGKPDPAIFRHALNMLSVDEDEAIMVGDNPNTDILGASRVGMTSVWINHHDRKSDVSPSYEIDCLSGILPLIQKMNGY